MGTCLQDIELNDNNNKDENKKSFSKNNLIKNEEKLTIENFKIFYNSDQNELENLEREKHIDGRPYSISFKKMKFYVNQMEKSICKIKKSNNVSGTGFICKIIDNDNSVNIQALFTCNHILDSNDIVQGSEITLIFNNNIIKNIKLLNNKTIYTNEDEYDITIIEINKDDNLNDNDMLTVDQNIFNDQLYNYYKKRQIYIIHYPKGNEIRYSCDLIKNIDINDIIIEHLCSTDTGSSGAPIIDSETERVIGIHNGYNNVDRINYGTLIKNPVEEFIQKYKVNNS